METWPLIREQTGRGNKSWLFILSLRASLRGKVWRAFTDFWRRPHWFYPTQLNKIQPNQAQPSPTNPNSTQLNHLAFSIRRQVCSAICLAIFSKVEGHDLRKFLKTTRGFKDVDINTNECMMSASWWWGKSCSKQRKRRYPKNCWLAVWKWWSLVTPDQQQLAVSQRLEKLESYVSKFWRISTKNGAFFRGIFLGSAHFENGFPHSGCLTSMGPQCGISQNWFFFPSMTY